MHFEDFLHEHGTGLTNAEAWSMSQVMLEQDTLQLRTVGIDVGSSTSHLLFATVFFERQGHRLSDRFVVVNRSIDWRSPILLTPFLPDGTIDAHALSHFFERCYRDAGIEPDEIDSGAVILTGEAVKRRNARAIDEIFAASSGKFVCATAGHRLESVLAAHGSGATELSRSRDACGLHVDIGGGTTKLALIDHGTIRSVAAFAVGGRLLARDDTGRWTRVDGPAETVAKHLGIATDPDTLADPAVRARIVDRFARLIVDQIAGEPLDELGHALELTEPLERTVAPDYLTFSGGVAEYLFGHQSEDYGDVARDLAAALIAELRDRVDIPAIDAGQCIRATAIGAGQFTVQVSGKTIHMSDRAAPAIRNIPVVRLPEPLPETIEPEAVAADFRAAATRQDVDLNAAVALAIAWPGAATYDRLAAIGRAIDAVAGPDRPADALLVVVVDADIAQSLGALLAEEYGRTDGLIVLDGIELRDLDFVDVGTYTDPPGVVPLVIKSLLFS
ncbi:MAG TPA: ethanolamine ammonia-lyase reactivating factor EutA [Micromonosporaceae bacterium]|jgi:ethanolamine utilization protein EutA